MGRARVLVLLQSFPVMSETVLLDHVIGLAEKSCDTVVVAQQIDEAYFKELAGGVAEEVTLVSIPDITNWNCSRLQLRPR